MIVDAQGAVTQVTILKGFTVTAVYDERFSDMKGNAVPALDQVMVQALSAGGQNRDRRASWIFIGVLEHSRG